jgi:hypothetical protein
LAQFPHRTSTGVVQRTMLGSASLLSSDSGGFGRLLATTPER